MNMLIDTDTSGYIMNKITDVRLIAGATSFMVSLLACASIVDTVYQTPPVNEITSAVVLSDSTITLTRYFHRNNDYPVVINNYMVSPDGKKSVQLSESTYPQQLIVSRAFPIPVGTHGLWCMHGYMKYKYRLSWAEHVEELNPVCMDFR